MKRESGAREKAIERFNNLSDLSMIKLIYISIILLSMSLNAQTTIPECGMTLRDTLVTEYVDFGICGNLVMTNESFLKVEYLTGNGIIQYVDSENELPKIEFTTCYPYEQGNVYIGSEIIIITPLGCETLSIEDVNTNDQSHLYNFQCVVYNVLGQKIYEGKFGKQRLTDRGIFFARFEHFTIKIPITK